MSATHTVNVALDGRSYPIVIGQGLLARAGELVTAHAKCRRAIIVSDHTVAKLYAAPLIKSLGDAGIRADLLEVAAGEGSKSFANLGVLLEAMLALQPDRHTAVIALGGGVVGDLAGFAASVLLRGVPFIQIPTTLLAQVDSSVGGKTAVNAGAGKNLIGSFYQPQLVLADLDTLQSLPKREWLAGYAEIIKYGLIMNAEFYRWCLANAAAMLAGDGGLLAYAVEQSCRMKAEVVADDEREGGRRAILNFGHTFGHALEAELQYDGRLLHGEAVAIGMCMACDLSARLGLADATLAAELAAHFKTLGLMTTPTDAAKDWDVDAVVAHFASDKKTQSGELNFVVLRALGEAMVQKNVNPALAREVVSQYVSKL